MIRTSSTSSAYCTAHGNIPRLRTNDPIRPKRGLPNGRLAVWCPPQDQKRGPGQESSMKYRYLGRSGLLVSRLCLGTMTFGNSQWGCDQDVSSGIVRTFVEGGGN